MREKGGSRTTGHTEKTCQKEINAFHKEINTIVDSLEEDSYKELENLESEQRLEIEEHISACTTTDQMLEADIRYAETIIKTKKNYQIYAADVKISNRLKQYSTSLEDSFNRLLKPVLTFKRKEELIKALKNAPGLWHLQRITTALAYCQRTRKICHS